MNIKYYLLNPAGNITILVETPVKENDRRFVASLLMKEEPSCEQVGFLSGNRLDMAGGEFCGNATRCTAFLTGSSEIICAGQKITCEGTAAYIPKNLSGIKHKIIEGEIENPEEYIKSIANGEATGLMFWNEKEQSLKPLVYVPSVDSMFWENSCASGTAALAEYLVKKYNKAIDMDIKEPGGIINIKSDPNSEYVRLDGSVILEKEGELCIPELNY